MTTTAIFIRHGQTDYNLRGLCNDDPGRPVHLTALGKRQAETAGRALAAVPIARIICSELPRTRETAEIINRHHGVAITVHAGINDWRTGMDGQPSAALYVAIAADPLHTRIGDGETLAEHRRRIARFIDWLRGQPEETVAVVAHEETLRAAHAIVHGLGDREMLETPVENGEIMRLAL